jgi:NTP pyrophosphatase (non-canonical NTP hydrolase)
MVITSDLTASILEFRMERDWQQFHTSRNLAVAVSIEAAELLEPFRWSSNVDVGQIAESCKQEIADEIADLVILLTYLANDLSINVGEAVTAKLAANARKYPVEKFRGSSKKYSDP